jgi:hypothetical protein
MNALEEAAGKKFAEPVLTEAEKLVLLHTLGGTIAECVGLGGGDDPANPEKWPKERDVRADLIRWLCVDPKARELVAPKGVWIRGARIMGPLDLSFIKVPFPLVLSSCRLEEHLDIRWAKIPVLSLQGSWTKAITAGGLHVEGALFLCSGFHAEGAVVLLGATIGGSLNAEGGTFKNPDPTGNALSADGIKVCGSVMLRKKFVAQGEVHLHSAVIDGQLEVDDVWLDKLNLDSAHIGGPFVWRNVHKVSDPCLPETKKEWNPFLDLTNAKVGSLVDLAASWPAENRLRLDGFIYDRIASSWSDWRAAPGAKMRDDAKVPIDAKSRIDWLHLQKKEDGYLPQPYEQLVSVLRRMGHEDQVADVAIAKQKDLYDHGNLGWWGKVWSWFLFLVIGYGYKPWWAFGWMVALVIAGTFVFSAARWPSVGLMVASDKEAYQKDEKTEKTPLPGYYQDFHPLVYSLDVVLPFDLGQKSHWRLIKNKSDPFVYWIFESYSLFQLFAGWVLLLVAGAVPAGFIKKD